MRARGHVMAVCTAGLVGTTVLAGAYDGVVTWGDATWDAGSGSGTVDVMWQSSETLAGFQFNVPTDQCTLTGVTGLECDETWSLHSTADLVLCFANGPSGHIPPSESPLGLVTIEFTANEGAEILFVDAIFATPDAQAIEVDATDIHVVGQAPCTADVHPPGGDGVVDVNEILAILADWGSTKSPYDVNGDGVVNVTDVLAVLEAWGQCP